MKYRCLTYQEFALLKDDFKEYLYSHKLETFEWRVLQDQNSLAAQSIIQNYSDTTFDKVFQEIEYLEIRTSRSIQITHFKSNLATTIGIKAPKLSSVDFNDMSCLSKLNPIDLGGFRCYEKSFPYKIGREKTIFSKIEKGAIPVDSETYDFLKLMRQTFQN